MPEPYSATPDEIRQYVEEGNLHWLVAYNPSVEDVQALLDKYPDKVEEEDKDGELPLHNAAYRKASVDVINLLLEKNKSAAEKKNSDGKLPIHHAVTFGGYDYAVSALLRAYPGGAKAKDNKGKLPLHLALSYGECGVDVVDALLVAYLEGAKVKDKKGRLPLHYALWYECGLDVVKAVIDAYRDGAKEKDNHGELPLHFALFKKCECEVAVVKALIDAYPEGVEEKDEDGKLPLHLAIELKCKVDVVKALLGAYRDGAKEKDNGGDLPLHIALYYKLEVDVVKAVLGAYPGGAKIKDENGKLPLHYALVNKCEVDVVMALLDEYPKGLILTDNEGKLPLHIALQHDVDFDIIRGLDRYPRGWKEVDNYGNLPLHIAVQYYKRGVDLIGDMLDMYSKGVKTRNNEGKLPLQVAIEHEREADVVEMLFQAYPEGVKTLSKVGKQSFSNAIEKGYPKEVVFALLQADMPMDNDGNFVEHDDSWNACIASEEIVAVAAVRFILSKKGSDFGRYIHTLMDVRDARGRQALGLASERALSEINVYLLFCYRYRLNLGSPEHRTLTSLLLRALDLNDKTDYGKIFDEADKDNSGTLGRQEMNAVAISIGLNPDLFLKGSGVGECINRDEFVSICKRQLGDGPREVVIKLMRSKEHWEREYYARKNHNLSPKYVVSVLPNVPSENDISGAVKNGSGGLDIIKEKYLKDIEIGKYAIVMDAADRNLHQIFYQEQPKIDAVRDMLKQVFEAVNHLHGKKLMHGDLKMLNIVRFRIDNRLRLIDFDASSKIMQPGEEGESFAGAKFSSAILPPEMIAKIDPDQVQDIKAYWGAENDQGLIDKVAPKAHMQRGIEIGRYVVKSFRTKESEPVFEGLPYELVDASENIDAWSLGVLAFSLLTGEPLIPSTRDDDCASGAAMHLLYSWGKEPEILTERFKKIRDDSARDLVQQLLQREPEKRPTIAKLLESHAFFHPENQQSMNKMAESLEEMNISLQVQAKQMEMINANLLVMKKLSLESKIELLVTREALMKGIFEADEADIPTTFILSQYKLSELEKLKEGDSQKRITEYIQNMMKMLKEGVQKQLVEETMYLYLVDELTGKPVQEEGWPIAVNKPSKLMRRLLPLMRVGVRGMSIYNGAVDVLKMFGIGFVADAAKIPKWLLDDLQTMVEELKQKTSVEDFDVVHDVLQEGNDKKMTVRGKPLREFKDFMEKNDPGLKKKKNGHFAGLRRIGDPDQGTALWTKLTNPEDIEHALKERSRQRKELEARQRKEKEGKQ